MRKSAWLACALNGFLFGGVKLFYEFCGGSFAELLFCTFLGITVTLAVGAEGRKLPFYLGNLGIGFFWVWLYIETEVLLLQFSLPDIMGKAIAFGLASFVIETVNLLGLSKSRWHYPALQFAVIVGCFSQKCRQMPLVLLALVLGVGIGVISKQIYANCLKHAK